MAKVSGYLYGPNDRRVDYYDPEGRLVKTEYELRNYSLIPTLKDWMEGVDEWIAQASRERAEQRKIGLRR